MLRVRVDVNPSMARNWSIDGHDSEHRLVGRVGHAPYKAEEERHPIREAPTIILGFLPCISNNDMDSIAFPKGRLPARS